MQLSPLKFSLLIALISVSFGKAVPRIVKVLEKELVDAVRTVVHYPVTSSVIEESIRNLEVEILVWNLHKHRDIYNVAKNLYTALDSHMVLPQKLLKLLMELHMLLTGYTESFKRLRFAEINKELKKILRRLRNLKVPPELRAILDRDPDSITPSVRQRLPQLRHTIEEISNHRLLLIKSIKSIPKKGERYFG